MGTLPTHLSMHMLNALPHMHRTHFNHIASLMKFRIITISIKTKVLIKFGTSDDVCRIESKILVKCVHLKFIEKFIAIIIRI